MSVGIPQHKMINEFIIALGLDMKNLLKFDLRIRIDEALTITTVSLVSEDDLSDAIKVINKYHVHSECVSEEPEEE